MVVGRLGTEEGAEFGRCPESLAEEFGLYVVGNGESLKDLSKVMT